MKVTTDGKRLARGEHWNRARYHLRASHGVHQHPWRVLLIAGPTPEEEIRLVKQLMPRSYVVAVDINPEHVERAQRAGADQALLLDIFEDYRRPTGSFGGFTRLLPKRLWDLVSSPLCKTTVPHHNKFDILSLDLCGHVDSQLSSLVARWSKLLLQRWGIGVVTFSYGRDVCEVSHRLYGRAASQEGDVYAAAGIPPHLAMRLHYLFAGRSVADSVLSYAGNAMPMCSVLFHSDGFPYPVAYCKITPGDFEIMAGHLADIDASALYACPKERIESMRRSHAAIKAAYTRTNKPHRGEQEPEIYASSH